MDFPHFYWEIQNILFYRDQSEVKRPQNHGYAPSFPLLWGFWSYHRDHTCLLDLLDKKYRSAKLDLLVHQSGSWDAKQALRTGKVLPALLSLSNCLTWRMKVRVTQQVSKERPSSGSCNSVWFHFVLWKSFL